ncbi:MAG: zinc-binding dehydrogenase [Actinobacteria bacterium]|nr:zinc-binding dehydrogenase [Actinomycetota bacterium]
MRAVVIQAGGELLIEERPDPQASESQVLVGVESSGLNGADQLQRRGFYPAPAGVVADIPGLEIAGSILAIGSQVSDLHVGDRVMAVVAGGGQASHICVEAAELLRVPEQISWAEAGGFPEAFTTAHDALVTQAQIAAGARVYISGGAGGVGTAAIQIAKAFGCEVVASVRNEDLRPQVAELGATVIDSADVGEHGPYDVVLELIGASDLEAVLPHLNPFARVVVIGVGGGAKAEINLLGIMSSRAIITGSTLRARSASEKGEVALRVRQDLLEYLAEGKLRVPVAASYPLDEVEAAYARFAAGAKFGKVVLLKA